MICVSIAESSQSVIESVLSLNSCYAECAEIRLDALSDTGAFDFHNIINFVSIPLIFTNRSRDEGGLFQGAEKERLLFLLKAVHAGAAYVDIELKTERDLFEHLIHEVKKFDTKIIVSYHDFSITPSETKLIEVFDRIKDTGADIAKIVTMARTSTDMLRILSLYRDDVRCSFPLAAFCMGEMGKASRIMSMALGACLVYTSPCKSKSTAPGQISINDFNTIISLLQNESPDVLQRSFN